MEKWSGKYCVVTGASAGIGAAISVALANHGVHVIGLARRANMIEALKPQVSGTGSIIPRACDVSDSKQIADTFSWIDQEFGGVDIIVNNAALMFHGQITELGDYTLTEDEITSQIDVNIKGVVLCSRRTVASVLKRGSYGHVININSLAGHYVPFAPIMNVYSATKYAITAFTETLKEEVSSFDGKIRVTSISPGLVNTDMVRSSRIPELEEQIKKMRGLDPEDVAGAVVYALSAPEHVNISEITIQIIGEKRF